MKSAFKRILFACVSMCVASDLNAQLVVAHRGASFDAPENTRASFQLAWEKGADAIEADVYLTRDQEIVCIHDATTKRVSDRNLEVGRSTLTELQRLDVGRWKGVSFAGERIPTLQEALTTIPKGKCIYIEIKCGAEIVPVLRRVLSESRLSPTQTLIISFDESVIRSAKRIIPQLTAYWLVEFRKSKETGKWSPTVDDVIATAKAVHADGVDLEGNTEVVDSHFASCCRDAGLSIHVWTVDDEDIARRFQQLGVGSITTNRPDIVRQGLFAFRAVNPSSHGISSGSEVPQAVQTRHQ